MILCHSFVSLYRCRVEVIFVYNFDFLKQVLVRSSCKSFKYNFNVLGCIHISSLRKYYISCVGAFNQVYHHFKKILKKYCLYLRIVCIVALSVKHIYSPLIYSMMQVHVFFIKKKIHNKFIKKTKFLKLHMTIIITQSFILNKPHERNKPKYIEIY